MLNRRRGRPAPAPLLPLPARRPTSCSAPLVARSPHQARTSPQQRAAAAEARACLRQKALGPHPTALARVPQFSHARMASPPRRRAGADGWAGYADTQQARSSDAAAMLNRFVARSLGQCTLG
jgi:hypothetical protein